jgi:hypothetical protein
MPTLNPLSGGRELWLSQMPSDAAEADRGYAVGADDYQALLTYPFERVPFANEAFAAQRRQAIGFRGEYSPQIRD